MRRTRSLILAFGLLVLGMSMHSRPIQAQEKSVRPGINQSFVNPDVDQFVKRFEGESREVFEKRQQVVKACSLKPGMVVADIGAGTGLYTRLFATRVGPQGKVYAVDISPKFLAYIAESAQKLNINNIKTILGKDTSPGLPAQVIDVAFLCDTYHHFEFPTRMMLELHRALKPGGRVVLIDFIRIPGQSREWILNHVRAGQPIVEKEITACGFRKVAEQKDLLSENYFMVFEKVNNANAKPDSQP